LAVLKLTNAAESSVSATSNTAGLSKTETTVTNVIINTSTADVFSFFSGAILADTTKNSSVGITSSVWKNNYIINVVITTTISAIAPVHTSYTTIAE